MYSCPFCWNQCWVTILKLIRKVERKAHLFDHIHNRFYCACHISLVWKVSHKYMRAYRGKKTKWLTMYIVSCSLRDSILWTLCFFVPNLDGVRSHQQTVPLSWGKPLRGGGRHRSLWPLQPLQAGSCNDTTPPPTFSLIHITIYLVKGRLLPLFPYQGLRSLLTTEWCFPKYPWSCFTSIQ